VYRTGQRFGAAHVIDVLRGAETQKVHQFGHEQLSTYGVGKDLDSKQWRSVVRQLVAGGWLQVDVEGHGALRLTSESAALLKGERTVTLRAEAERVPKARREARASEGMASMDEEATTRFDALRAWRSGVAREQNVPAYVIFHDATLRQIALAEPANLDALARSAASAPPSSNVTDPPSSKRCPRRPDATKPEKRALFRLRPDQGCVAWYRLAVAAVVARRRGRTGLLVLAAIVLLVLRLLGGLAGVLAWPSWRWPEPWFMFWPEPMLPRSFWLLPIVFVLLGVDDHCRCPTCVGANTLQKRT
jgi:hypothetical protein